MPEDLEDDFDFFFGRKTVYKIVREYSGRIGCKVGAHWLRATATTNALQNSADLAKTQAWLGHCHIGTTRLYDHRTSRPEDSPTFRVAY
jgi:integrase/recombinase XerD